MDSNNLKSHYNEYYYNNCCGAPYVRGGAIWNFFSTIADQIVTKIAPKTVLDVGCAKGFLVEFLRKRGIAAWGLDISDYAISEIASEIRPYCHVGSVTDSLEKNYDLIVCQEVLEHVSKEDAQQAIRNICAHTSDILFSSSPLDLTEPTHINIQPPEMWGRLFAEQGFFRDCNFDSSFITSWAVRFRKKNFGSILELAESYEKELWRIKCESLRKAEQIVNFNHAVTERDGRIADLHHAVTERESKFIALQNELRGIYSSKKWKLIIKVATPVFRVKQWWFANEFPRKFLERILIFFRGETEAGKKLAKGSLLFSVDNPGAGLLKITQGSYVVSGWAVNLETHSAANIKIVVDGKVHNPPCQQRDDVRRVFASRCELPPSTGFFLELKLPVGVHWMRIEVESIDGSWVPIRQMFLFRKPRICALLDKIFSRQSYQSWVRIERKRFKKEIPDIAQHIVVMIHKPIFTIIIDSRQGNTGLSDTMESIHEQLYPHSEVRILADVRSKCTPSLPANVKILEDMLFSGIKGDFIIFMQSGQRFSINALYEFANAINKYPDIDLVYGDEDSWGTKGNRHNPFCKPDWSPDYLETFNYIGFAACFRTAVAQNCFKIAHPYDFILRFTERTTRVLHVSKILGHNSERHDLQTESANLVSLDIEALSGRLIRTSRRGSICEDKLHKGCYNIQLNLKRSPLVSIIIPTAGKVIHEGEKRIDLIENVIRQIRDRSTYKNIEIVVVDNGDLSSAQIQLLGETACQRITYSNPVFNVPKKLNLGASIARGEMLLLLNDDIEILTPSWIERMLEQFEKPHVGVVGAKLLYPDGTIQHAGVVFNFGNADHARRGFPGNDAGYFFSTCGVRNYSAVTGACMLTPANLFREVGGYSEELAVSFNDVDYCLKVQEKGFWVVYSPSTELTHMESQSRVASLDMGELAWYHHRWATRLVSDPFYNELFLKVAPPTFVPCVNQRQL